MFCSPLTAVRQAQFCCDEIFLPFIFFVIFHLKNYRSILLIVLLRLIHFSADLFAKLLELTSFKSIHLIKTVSWYGISRRESQLSLILSDSAGIFDHTISSAVTAASETACANFTNKRCGQSEAALANNSQVLQHL